MKYKKQIITISIVVIVLASLIIGVSIYKVNKEVRMIDKYTEVTFVSPTQAIIFWKSKGDTLGYLKYGEKKYKRNNTELQTTSVPGEVHVVFLENIPLEGIFISTHLESDSMFIWPRIQKIQYTGEEDIYE